MGRLTLNILLSCAQFEREVIGERIKDKFAASRAKGMWMGGIPPLGYDVRDRKLVVNRTEAELVRLIFRRFLDLGSALLLIRELNADGHRTKSWMSRRAPFARVGRSKRARCTRSCATAPISARPCTRGASTRASTSRSSVARSGLPAEAAAAIRDRRASLAGMSLPPELDDAQREAVRAAIAEAFIVGYRAVMAIAAGLALTSAGVAWLMIGPNQPRRELTAGGGDRIRRVTAGATHPRVLPAE